MPSQYFDKKYVLNMRGRYNTSEYWIEGRENSIKSRNLLFSGKFHIYLASISLGSDIMISA